MRIKPAIKQKVLKNVVHSMRSFCSKELQLRHLSLGELNSAHLWHSQKHGKLCRLRLAMFSYTFSMLLLNYSGNRDIMQAFKLTHWSQFVLNLSFFINLLYAPLTVEHSSLRKIIYVLQNLSLNLEMIVCLAFWALIAPGKTSWDFFTIHLHVILFGFAIINVYLLQLPVRFLHFLYSSAFLLCYSGFNYALHVSGVESSVYKNVIDWDANQTKSAVLLVCMSTLGPLLSNTFLFVLMKWWKSGFSAKTDSYRKCDYARGNDLFLDQV